MRLGDIHIIGIQAYCFGIDLYWSFSQAQLLFRDGAMGIRRFEGITQRLTSELQFNLTMSNL